MGLYPEAHACSLWFYRARTIPYPIGMIALIRELWYTICQMQDEAPAAPFLPAFIALHQ